MSVKGIRSSGLAARTAASLEDHHSAPIATPSQCQETRSSLLGDTPAIGRGEAANATVCRRWSSPAGAIPASPKASPNRERSDEQSNHPLQDHRRRGLAHAKPRWVVGAGCYQGTGVANRTPARCTSPDRARPSSRSARARSSLSLSRKRPVASRRGSSTHPSSVVTS
jgi:hypothetical protein